MTSKEAKKYLEKCVGDKTKAWLYGVKAEAIVWAVKALEQFEEEKLELTKEDFQVDDDAFKKIKDFVDAQGLLYSEALDYHVEETEADMFNWLYRDNDMTPYEIKTETPLPRDDTRCLEVNGLWYFWYIA